MPEEQDFGDPSVNRTKRPPPASKTELQKHEEQVGVTIDIELCSSNEERIASSQDAFISPTLSIRSTDQDRSSAQEDVTAEQTTPRPEPEPSSEKWRRRRILSVYLLTSTIL